MRVDPKGFYLCWVDQNNEIDLLDIATIRDVRTGQYAKKPRVSKLNQICYMNINYVFPSNIEYTETFLFYFF